MSVPLRVPEDQRSASLALYHRNREAVLERKRQKREADNPWTERPCLVCDKPYPVREQNVRRRYCSASCARKVRNLSQYGLSIEDYRSLTASGRCFICQRKIKKWHVDHDHKTLETWGVICERCNTMAVAAVERNADIARRLVTYIEQPPARDLDGTPRMTRTSRIGSWQRRRQQKKETA